MAALRDVPIRSRLTRVILLSCSAALLLACGVLAAYEVVAFRQAMARDMTVLADVIATNTRAALAFQDETAAKETLAALEVEGHVKMACLYGPDGGLFVRYRRTDGPHGECPRDGPRESVEFLRDRLALHRPVLLNGKRIGSLYVEAGLEGVTERLLVFGGIAVIALAGSLSLAFLLSSRMQRPISGPILSLAETARAIAEGKDYSARASADGPKEIGMLTDAFNLMLAAIQDHESALRSVNESLTTEVAERKQAEGRATSQLVRLELLNQITRAIGERQDLQSIFQVVVSAMEEHLPVDFTCVCLHEAKADQLAVACVGKGHEAASERSGLSSGARIDIGRSGLARCLQGQVIYEPDVAQGDLTDLSLPRVLADSGLRAMVVAPLMVDKTAFGILVAARRGRQSFSSAECEFLRQLADHTALAAHQAQLHGALQGAYDELRQTQQAAMQQERLRALGQMASGIAHDINNAISPISLYTESLLDTEPHLSPRARGYLTTIQRAIDDVAHTVARMREFYRHREPQLQLTPMQLNRLVEQVVDLSRARWSDMAQSRGAFIEVTTALDAELPEVMGIESEIREALLNLVFNAVDAMPAGGRLTLQTRSIEASHPTPSRRVQVRVTDTGVGMDEDTRRRCLEPFFTTKGERGTGLGLAMVYGVVQRHGAELTVESVSGRGTTIGIAFDAPAALAGAAPEAPATSVLPALRLLVVDDDPLLIASLRETLQGDGHRVEVADGGQAGIEAFRAALANPFDAVITDLGMPFVDGRRVSEAIKGMSPSTPVVLLTGWGQRLVTEGDVPAHVDCVVNKPPRLRDIREALAACLKAKAG